MASCRSSSRCRATKWRACAQLLIVRVMQAAWGRRAVASLTVGQSGISHLPIANVAPASSVSSR